MRERTRRRAPASFVWRTCGALLLSLLALPPAGHGDEAPRRGGVLRAGMQTDPVGLDPHTTNATATRNLLENVYETLVRVDADGRIVPALAQSYSVSADGLTWTFRLRQGVLFHDGSPLRAQDVVDSLSRIRDPRLASPRADDLAPIQSVSAQDQGTVVLRLRSPFSPLLGKLAFSLNVILPSRGQDPQRTIIGTGPFRFVSYAPQGRLVLARNERYWGRDAAGRPLPYLDGIEFRFYPDGTARTLALRAGQADWIEYVPAAEVRLLQRLPGLLVQGGPGANFRALLLNLSVPPLRDQRVRQALSHAIDRQALVRLALFGTGGVAAPAASVPPGNPYALPGPSPYPASGRDLPRARRLLAEAGYAGGFPLTLYVTSTYDFLRAPAEVVQANLRDVGVRVQIRAADWSVFLPDVLGRRFQAAVFGESGLLDPDDFLYQNFHSQGSQNFGGFADRDVDRLLDEGRGAPEGPERRRRYDQVQRRVLDQAPQIFLFHSSQYEAHGAHVRGYRHWPNNSYIGLATTWLSQVPPQH